jgi:hypothetical protein
MIGYLLLAIGVVIFLALLYGPLESLGWWRAKGAEEVPDEARKLLAQAPAGDKPAYEHYVIYLSGIGAIDPTSIPKEEIPLPEELARRLPTFCVARDVFPYSVDNNGLTAQRVLAGLWRQVAKLRIAKPESMLTLLVNARNAIQVLVCADRRYGPTYNIGTAREVIRCLRRHGYPFGSGVPVTLLGWSGGAQISLGAANYLSMVDLPLRVISLGGVFSDDTGLDRLQHFTHLRGSKDPLERLGRIIFPGRWPWAVGSPWTRARDDGRSEVIVLGPMVHTNAKNYFDHDTIAPDGRSYFEVTADAIEAILTGQPVKVVEEAGPSAD